MPSLERQSVFPTFDTVMFKIPNMHFMTISGLAVTLTFDVLTSISNQFIFVPNCSSVVSLVKLSQALCKISCSQSFSM